MVKYSFKMHTTQYIFCDSLGTWDNYATIGNMLLANKNDMCFFGGQALEVILNILTALLINKNLSQYPRGKNL